MKLALYLGGEFSERNQSALMEIVEAMSQKHRFDYEWVNVPTMANFVFFQDTTKGFPEELSVPQLILSAGKTYQSPKENQHVIYWAHLERTICLLASVISHDRSMELSDKI